MPFNNPIVGGRSILIREAIRSPNYVPSTTGWTINRDGTAEFSAVFIRADPALIIGDVPLSGAGGELFVGGDVAGPSAGMTVTVAAGNLTAYAARVENDAVTPWLVRGRGDMLWGPGNAARDTGPLGRGAAGRLDLTSTDFRIATAGRGLQVAEGANAKMGASTLVAGTVVVATTAVTANSRIFLTGQNNSGTAGELTVSARTAGTSFTILSTSGTDTRSVAWLIIEP